MSWSWGWWLHIRSDRHKVDLGVDPTVSVDGQTIISNRSHYRLS